MTNPFEVTPLQQGARVQLKQADVAGALCGSVCGSRVCVSRIRLPPVGRLRCGLGDVPSRVRQLNPCYSDGTPRNILSVTEQLEDYGTVVKYARQQAELDPQRVILWGTSFSGMVLGSERSPERQR